MSRQYQNLSVHLNNLMEMYNINDTNLSLKTGIHLPVLKNILKGNVDYMGFRHINKLSKAFGMQIFEFIDYISQ